MKGEPKVSHGAIYFRMFFVRRKAADIHIVRGDEVAQPTFLLDLKEN